MVGTKISARPGKQQLNWIDRSGLLAGDLILFPEISGYAIGSEQFKSHNVAHFIRTFFGRMLNVNQCANRNHQVTFELRFNPCDAAFLPVCFTHSN